MRIAVAVLLMSVAARAEWTPPSRLEIALHVASQALIALDTLQSMDIRNHPGIHEMNPLLGEHPTAARFALTLGVSSLLTTAIWYALPSPARNVLPISLIAVEIPLCATNHFTFGLRPIRF